MPVGKFLVIDTETTGLNTQKNILIQLAAMSLDKDLNIIETFCADVKGEGDFAWEPEALKVNGFTLERIRNGEPSQQVAENFLQFLERNFFEQPTFIGQFFCFDYAVLGKFMEDHGKTSKWLSLTKNKIIDTKSLVLAANLQAELNGENLPFPVTSLSNPGGLKDKFNITTHTAHDALGDIMATREVLLAILKNYPFGTAHTRVQHF